LARDRRAMSMAGAIIDAALPVPTPPADRA
jgi:hypothetical protein